MLIGEIPRGFQLALDLLGSRGVEDGRRPDQIATPADLRAWLVAHALGEALLPELRTSPAAAALLLAEIRRLRDAVGRAVEAFAGGEPVPADSAFAIDRVLAASRTVRTLEQGRDGLRVREDETASDPLAVLAPIALGAAELLTSADPARVRRCAAEDCHEWFVDTSKGGRRRWCSMERCGNRAKAARHRRKRRAS